MPELDIVLDSGGRLGKAELDLIIGRTVQKVMSPPDRMTLWRQLGAPIVKRVGVAGTVIAAQAGLSTATAFFAFEARPQVGRMWSVRKVALMAGSPPVTNAPFASAIANLTAVIYTTQGGTTIGAGSAPPPQDTDQTAFSLPATQFYSTHQLWVRGGEWLVVGIQGSAVVTGFQIWGHARVVEIDDSPEFLMTL